jgi:hypothetical protein
MTHVDIKHKNKLWFSLSLNFILQLLQNVGIKIVDDKLGVLIHVCKKRIISYVKDSWNVGICL